MRKFAALAAGSALVVVAAGCGGPETATAPTTTTAASTTSAPATTTAASAVTSTTTTTTTTTTTAPPATTTTTVPTTTIAAPTPAPTTTTVPATTTTMEQAVAARWSPSPSSLAIKAEAELAMADLRLELVDLMIAILDAMDTNSSPLLRPGGLTPESARSAQQGLAQINAIRVGMSTVDDDYDTVNKRHSEAAGTILEAYQTGTLTGDALDAEMYMLWHATATRIAGLRLRVRDLAVDLQAVVEQMAVAG